MLEPPPAVIKEQHKASNPAVSAWVSANAGSGKTHVLTERVIRLLLTGTPPEKILCITFTKAAAANMATRVFDTLSKWTALDDAGLDAKISALGLTPSADARARARRLFAVAIETPGGLKVQTIHAFCTRLLHQFPFEAGVAARFNVLDEATERQLLEKLTLDVVLEGAANPGSALGKALETAITAAADQTFREVIRTAIGKRDLISGWISRAGSLDGVIAELSQALGVSPDETVDSVEAEFFSAALIPHAQWSDVAAVLAQGQATDIEQARRFASMRERSGQEQLDLLLEIHCTRTFEPRTRLVTKTIADAHPAIAERLRNEQIRICALLERRRALLCRDRTRALLTVAYAIITRYRLQKERRGLLDYDDLIDKTLALLRNTSAAWVLYKLDLGIDHILIDEAQDTSPRQWEIIRALANEFTAGAGARGIARTLFAVGDDKQSIFSFQGADPKIFAEIAGGSKGISGARSSSGNRCGCAPPSGQAPPFSARSISFSKTRRPMPDSPPIPPARYTKPCPMPRRVRSTSGRSSCPTTGMTSKAGMLPSTPDAKRARRCALPARLRGRRRDGSGKAGSRATLLSSCASAAPCSNPSFARSKPPTSRLRARIAWCSPNISR
jgi:ATP-dependent helicase/nuclease subunit A